MNDGWDLIEQAFDSAWDAVKTTRPRFGIKRSGGSRVGATDFDPVTTAFAAGIATPYIGKKISQGMHHLGKPFERAMGSGFAEKKQNTSRLGKLIQAPAKAGRGGPAAGHGGVSWPPKNAASRVTGRQQGRRPSQGAARAGAHGRPIGRPVSQLGGVRRSRGSFALA